MYFLKKKLEIAAAHKLPNYSGKCRELHGHNWFITVHCCCEDSNLDDHQMVLDFTEIKKIVNELDHSYLNDRIENPTAENIAQYLCNKIPACYMVEVEESKNNSIYYVKDQALFTIARNIGITKI